MDELKKYISQILDTVGRAQIIRSVAIYMLVVGVLSLCGGLALAGVGALGGFAGLASSSVIGSTAEGQEAAQQLVAASGFALIYGILAIITGPLMIIVGVGLFRRMRWARMGVVVVGAFSFVSSLLGLLSGSGGLNIVWVIVDAFLIYVFYTDAGITAEFEKPKNS